MPGKEHIMILIIDNYDSFTYNVAQVVEGLYPHVEVIRNDRITIEEIEKKTPEAIIISCLLYTSPSPRD